MLLLVFVVLFCVCCGCVCRFMLLLLSLIGIFLYMMIKIIRFGATHSNSCFNQALTHLIQGLRRGLGWCCGWCNGLGKRLPANYQPVVQVLILIQSQASNPTQPNQPTNQATKPPLVSARRVQEQAGGCTRSLACYAAHAALQWRSRARADLSFLRLYGVSPCLPKLVPTSHRVVHGIAQDASSSLLHEIVLATCDRGSR